jgi:hypothetical protein
MTATVQAARPAGFAPRLQVLAAEIKVSLAIAHRHGRATLAALMDAGDRLIEAKGALNHGQWDDWLSENFALSHRTASLYMQLAGHRARVEAKLATVATLGVRGALEAIHEDQIQEGREKRNREALAHALALQGDFAGPLGTTFAYKPPPKDTPTRYPYPKPVHSLADLNAERVQRAVKSILAHIDHERAELAAAGLHQQFDAELRRWYIGGSS